MLNQTCIALLSRIIWNSALIWNMNFASLEPEQRPKFHTADEPCILRHCLDSMCRRSYFVHDKTLDMSRVWSVDAIRYELDFSLPPPLSARPRIIVMECRIGFCYSCRKKGRTCFLVNSFHHPLKHYHPIAYRWSHYACASS